MNVRPVRFTARGVPVAAVLAACLLASGCVPLIIAGGIGAAAVVAQDRRSSEVILSDERIERTINSRIKNELKDDARVNVSAFNQIVLIAGEAKTEALKAEAGRIAGLVDGVRAIHNEIDVMPLRAPRQQFSDATTTTQVKARMVGNGVFNPIHIQASTDGGVVFLQGLVSQQEADEAARIAASTAGVRKVVRLFEITTPKP